MNSEELEILIKSCLDDFYKRRAESLSKLQLKRALARKNPYLFKAMGFIKANEVVEAMLRAFISSSDETIFGNAFFEPIAKLASRGKVSGAEGVDVEIETEYCFKAIAVKSGPNIFNASQKARQNDEFMRLRSRLHKLQKKFDPILGSCYGRTKSNPNSIRIYRHISGQEFWEEVTGDADFYVKLVILMRDYPVPHRLAFEKAFGEAVNRFSKEFLAEFCDEHGAIDWVKLVRFNSSKS